MIMKKVKIDFGVQRNSMHERVLHINEVQASDTSTVVFDMFLHCHSFIAC